MRFISGKSLIESVVVKRTMIILRNSNVEINDEHSVIEIYKIYYNSCSVSSRIYSEECTNTISPPHKRARTGD